MKKIIFVFLSATVISCGTQNKQKEAANESTEEVAAHTEQPGQEEMLLGLQKRQALQEAPFNSWFDMNYEDYEPEAEMVEKLKPLVNGIEIKVFMGTWCSDSQREVPAFFKLLDELNVPESKVTLITMNRDKVTPDNLEEGLDVTNVPTLIFYRDGKELNRIVEYPIDSLEEDMFKILNGEEYKHAYAW